MFPVELLKGISDNLGTAWILHQTESGATVDQIFKLLLTDTIRFSGQAKFRS